MDAVHIPIFTSHESMMEVHAAVHAGQDVVDDSGCAQDTVLSTAPTTSSPSHAGPPLGVAIISTQCATPPTSQIMHSLPSVEATGTGNKTRAAGVEAIAKTPAAPRGNPIAAATAAVGAAQKLRGTKKGPG
jgi:hypothetical protein